MKLTYFVKIDESILVELEYRLHFSESLFTIRQIRTALSVSPFAVAAKGKGKA